MHLQFSLIPFFTVFLVVHSLTCSTNSECDIYDKYNEIHYVAAVLEYTPSEDGNATERLQTNGEVFAEYAAQAKEQNADIVVFPEYGLTGGGMPISTERLLPFSLIIPDPSKATVPCDYPPDQPYSQALSLLSCTAVDLSIYLVVDLTEQVDCASDNCPDGYYFYNTQIVLDRQGAVIARYRKQHLFYEPGYTPGNEEAETAIFTTDFGVTFTLQICFDVMWNSPGVLNVVNHNITDVIMSTAWVDELPQLTAPQHFSGWSIGLGVNFLVSGLHKPTHGELGSGIFFGLTGDDPLYVWDATGGNELLVHNVTTYNSPKSDLIGQTHGTETITDNREDEPRNNFEMLDIPCISDDQYISHEDLSNYTFVVLNQYERDTVIIEQACQDELICCTVEYIWPKNNTDEGNYLLLVFSGEVTKQGEYTMYTETCSVVYCLSPNIEDCTDIENMVPSHNSFEVLGLRGDFNTEYVYPSVLTQDMQLFDKTLWTFVEGDVGITEYPHTIQFQRGKSVTNLLSLTMFGRWFKKDKSSFPPNKSNL